MKVLLYIILIFLTVCSCSNNRKSKVYEVFAVDTKRCDAITDFFDEYIIIPLETTEDNIIGNIDKISITDEYMYILDKQQAMIFVFDKAGRYINKIAHQGRALGEYQSISDFAVSCSYLYCLSRINKKIFVYDFNAAFVRSCNLNDWYSSFCVVNDSLMYLFSDENNEQYFNYVLYNYNTQQIIKKIDPFEHNQNYSLGYSPFHFTNDEIFVTEQYDETLYLLDDNGKQTFCLFDFKPLKKVAPSEKKMPREKLYDKIRNMEMLRNIKGVDLSDSVLTLGYSVYCNDVGIRDFVTRINLSTRQNKTIRLNDSVFPEFPFLFNILGFQNGQSVSYIPAALAIELDERYGLHLCDKYKMNESDNPLVVLHKFK